MTRIAHTVGIVLADVDTGIEVLRQVGTGTMFPAQPDILTHIPNVGEMQGVGLMQALVGNSFIYGLTKGEPELIEQEGKTVDGIYWPAYPKSIVNNVWSRMFHILNNMDQRMTCYDCSYTTAFYPGSGKSAKVRTNVYEMSIGEYDLKIHYVAGVGEAK